MKTLKSSELKTILHSKRANIYYLEHCRVLVKGGRVEYVTDEGNQSLYWNIPIANTTSILLGTGTSITQSAMRELSKAGVLIGFCGSGGTPLYCANEAQIDISWLSPQSEYRPTEYLQSWIHFWQDDQKRLNAAKKLQQIRIDLLQNAWKTDLKLSEGGFNVDHIDLDQLVKKFKIDIETAPDIMHLFTTEARLTKHLYKIAAETLKYESFTRIKQGLGIDSANRFLDHGNYLAYGLAATATWVLGLPHGLSILHGKTRRGGLVFDAADIIKDAYVLPQAFISAKNGDNDRVFRKSCVDLFVKNGALDLIIDSLKEIALTAGVSS